VITRRTGQIRLLVLISAFSASAASAHEQTLDAFLAASQAEGQEAQGRDSSPLAACELTCEIFDESTGQPLHGLIRVTDLTTGESVRLNRIFERPMGWFCSPPTAQFSVPRGRIRIEVCHGIETEILEMTLDLTGQTARSVKIPLKRFYEPAAHKLCSGNTHLHVVLDARNKMSVQLESRQETDQYLRVAGKADGLDIIYVSYLTRPGKEYITNEYTSDDFQRLSDQEVLFKNGEEYRHSGGVDPKNDNLSYGHVMFLDMPKIIEPASIGPGLTEGGDATDGVPLRRGIRLARSDKATIVWCHGKMGTEAVPNWVDGLIDAQNIYDGGNVGTIESVYYLYLNAGFKIPFSSGTDWGIWDFSRVYVPVEGVASSEAFRQALLQGRSFITNGVFLELDVQGHRPGGTIELDQPGSVHVRARAVGRADFKSLQLIYNGEIIREVAHKPNAGHHVAELDEKINITESGWLALRIPTVREYDIRSRLEGVSTNILGKTLFAHTSPIYFRVEGRELCQPAAVKKLIANLQSSIELIRTRGAFDSPHQKREILKIYEDAILKLSARLDTGESGE